MSGEREADLRGELEREKRRAEENGVLAHDLGIQLAEARQSAEACSSVGGDLYKGIEWLACWLLDNVEGETITEEQLRPWAQKAWLAHLDRKND